MVGVRGCSGRGKGCLNVDGYRHSTASLVQREVACVKSLVSRGVVSSEVEGYKKLNRLKGLCDCDSCEARGFCKVCLECGGVLDDISRCPLWHRYKSTVGDLLTNPLSYLSKKAAGLEVALEKQRMKDGSDGVVISKEMLAATKLALDAVKLVNQCRKDESRVGGRKVGGFVDDSDVVLDGKFFEEEKGGGGC